MIYFDSFGVKHNPKEIKNFIGYEKDIKQIYLEYKHVIQLCMVIFLFYSLILSLQLKID